MPKKAPSAEEQRARAAQAAAHKAADWIKVYIRGRKPRVMRRADYERLVAERAARG